MTVLEIKDRLIKDEIDYHEAYDLIKRLGKPWHTKEWAEKRNKLIKKECEQCNSSEGIMVIQHLTHPIEFATTRSFIFSILYEENLKSHTLPEPEITETDIREFKDKTTKLRNACPECKWIRIRHRKTVKGPLGDIMYRFKGLYEVDMVSSAKSDRLFWKRISGRVATYKPS